VVKLCESSLPGLRLCAGNPFARFHPEQLLKQVNALDEQLEYVSFFWCGFFFSYLEYDETIRDLSPVELYLRLNQAQYANIVAGTLTETGRAYQALLDRMVDP